MSQSVLIDRPPRIQPELPVETIEIPSPPQPGQSAHRATDPDGAAACSPWWPSCS